LSGLNLKKSVIRVPKGQMTTHDLHEMHKLMARVIIPSVSFSRALEGQTAMQGASVHFRQVNRKTASSRNVFNPSEQVPGSNTASAGDRLLSTPERYRDKWISIFFAISAPDIGLVFNFIIGKHRAIFADKILPHHAVPAFSQSARHVLFHGKINVMFRITHF
jgi:hypothetical protein